MKSLKELIKTTLVEYEALNNLSEKDCHVGSEQMQTRLIRGIKDGSIEVKVSKENDKG